jgi:hypothetical protein
MDFSTYKFRASQTGKLMTNARAKGETISETTKAYLLECFIRAKYGRDKTIISEAMIKGTMQEEDGITLLSRIDKKMYVKNEDNWRNDFLTGTPDIIDGSLVIDIKCSWDIFTFWKSRTSEINKDYYWQLQSYMDLLDLPKAKLVYCLTDTPDALIEGQKRRFMWDAGIKGEDQYNHEAFDQIEKQGKYSDIPIEERVFSFDVERSQPDIEALHIRIMEARIWMVEQFYEL